MSALEAYRGASLSTPQRHAASSAGSTQDLGALTAQLKDTLVEMSQLCEGQRRDTATTERMLAERLDAVEASQRRVADLRRMTQSAEAEAEDLASTSREVTRRAMEEEQRMTALRRRTQSRLDDARQQYDDAAAALAEANGQAEALARTVTGREGALRVEVEELGVRATELRVKTAILTAELEDRDREIEMQKLIREHRMEEEVKSQVSERQAMLGQARGLAAAREAEVAKESDAAVSAVMGQVYKLRTQLQNIREERGCHEATLRDAEADLEGLRADTATKAALARQVAEAEATVAQLQADALRGQALASQLGEVNQQRAATIATKRRCAERYDEVGAQAGALAAQLVHLETALGEVSTETDRVRHATAEFSSRRDAEGAARRAELNALEQETTRLREDVSAQISQWEAEIAMVSRESSDLEAMASGLLEHAEDKRQACATYERDIARMVQERAERRAAAALAIQSVMTDIL